MTNANFGKAEQRSLASQLDFPIYSSFSPDHLVSLYHGDCLDFLRTLPDQSVQLVVTSPPYNIGKEYEDVLDIELYKDQQRLVVEECVRVLDPRGSICWQVGNYVHNGEIIPLDILLYDIFKDQGLVMRNRIVWHFGHGLHCSNRFSGRYETIGSCGLQGETGHHQTSEEVGRDPFEIVGPLEHRHVEGQVLLVNATERT